MAQCVRMSDLSKHTFIAATTNDCFLGVEKSIHHLNNRIMRRIFQHLDVCDLSAVADSCSTFKKIAQAEFSSRYEMNSFDIDVQNDDEILFDASKIPLQRLASVFRNFGSLIRTSEMYFDSSIQNKAKQLIELIKKGCDENVDESNRLNIKFTVTIMPVRPTISSKEIFYSPKFHTLMVVYVRNEPLQFNLCVLIPEMICSNIDEFYNVGKTTMDIFLDLNPQLNRVKTEITVRNSERIIQLNQQNAIPVIEEISFVYMYTELDSIPFHMHPLKSLKLDFAFDSSLKIIHELGYAASQLECLKLKKFPSTQFSDIAQMKKLRKLELFYVVSLEVSDFLDVFRGVSELTELKLHFIVLPPNDLVEIVRCAPKLTILKYVTRNENWIIDENVYWEILEAVLARDTICRLVIELRGHSNMINVSDETKKGKDSMLYINEEKLDEILMLEQDPFEYYA